MTTRTSAHPLFSSPARLASGAVLIVLTSLAMQIASGVSPYRAIAPIELSSNAIAASALIWSLLQLRTYWRAPASRAAWLAAAAGSALLTVEGSVGELLEFRTQSAHEMAISIGFWLLAAYFLYRANRRFAMRRGVMTFWRIAFAIQLVAQYFGWLAAIDTNLTTPSAILNSYFNDTGELIAVLFYVAGLILAEFAPVKAYDARPHASGGLARRIARDFQIVNLARYPTSHPLLRLPAFREATLGAIIVWHVVRVAPIVARAGGPGVLRQLSDLLRLNGHGINPHSYYVLELFRFENAARCDEYLTRVETKNGLTTRIQATNRFQTCAKELNDKLRFTQICRERGLAVAPILGRVVDGALVDGMAETLGRDLFFKARKGRGAKIVAAFSYLSSDRYVFGRGAPLDFQGVLAAVTRDAPGHELLVQPKLGNHACLADLAHDTLVVFRVATALTAAGAPIATHGVMRIMRRFEPHWPKFPDKEWGAAIDLETGELGPLCGDMPDACMELRESHPVTGAAILGRRLERWPEIRDLALRAHDVFRGVTVIGWDIGLTPDGPVLLEGNSNMDVNFLQRCYRAPIARSPLGPLLDLYLRDVLAAEMRDLEAEPAATRSARARLDGPAADHRDGA